MTTTPGVIVSTKRQTMVFSCPRSRVSKVGGGISCEDYMQVEKKKKKEI